MPKPKKPVRAMHRWEKMAAGASDMEELLVEIYNWGGCESQMEQAQWDKIHHKIKAQLRRTGRIE